MAEQDLVELVADDGAATGSTTVASAHAAPGLLHRAFSVVAHDGAGSVLLQRRASVKLRFAGRWANTCCGHVPPGVEVETAAARRYAEELGVECGDLTRAGVHVYEAADPDSGMVEKEYDHVLLLRLDPVRPLAPDPDEVAETSWVRLVDWRDDVGAGAAPWLPGVLDVAAAALA